MARKKKLDKLSRDMIECEKAGFGCHYGRWKATQEPVKIEKIEIPEGSQKCPCCGKVFVPHNVRQKYCDAVCCNKASYQKHRERKKELARQRYAEKKRKGADNGKV